MPRRYSRLKKRKFTANQHTKAKKVRSQEEQQPSTSSADLPPIFCNSSSKKKNLDNLNCESNDNDFNIIMNFNILQSLFMFFAHCPECGCARVNMQNNDAKRQGFCLELTLLCCSSSCQWKHTVHTSKNVNCNNTSEIKPGRNAFAVNIQMVLAFGEIGKGYRSMKSFTSLMNIPPPISLRSYNRINDTLHNTYITVSNQSMVNAAQNTANSRHQINNETIKCPVSVDGTWQKRGHASTNGVVTVISNENEKCIDYDVLSKRCHGCLMWKNKKSSPQYIDWELNHDCQTNHTGIRDQ